MPETHLIYRQILDMTFASKKEAMDGQNTVSWLYRRELMPLISKIFDQLCTPNQLVRIDKMEIDLGRISARDFETDLKQKLRNKLEDGLIGEIQNRDAQLYENNEGSETNAKETPSGSSALEIFMFFIKTGQLPWWVTKEQFKSLDDLALTLIKNQPQQLIAGLLIIGVSDTFRQRIIHQFSDDILAQLIQFKNAESGLGEHLRQLHQDFYRLHEQKQIVSLRKLNFRLLLWQAAFDFWFFGDKPIVKFSTKDQPLKPSQSDDDERKLGGSATFRASRMQAYLIYVIQKLAENNAAVSGKKERTVNLIQKIYQIVIDAGIQNWLLGKMAKNLMNMPASTRKEMIADIDEAPREKEKDSRKNEENRRPELEDSFEIHNAGLVIIAPFLPRFFDALGLVSNSKFATDEATSRGVLLTQYIITGEAEMPEYELTLNKIVCGVPLDEPLPGVLDITEREKEEVQNLLKSVIEHWQALGSTSVDGLRQAFLMKDAMLINEPNGWTLRAERTGVDILLDRLPWGISVIKLPWNDDIIHVEW